MLVALVGCVLTTETAVASAFDRYALEERFDLPAGAGPFDLVPDGRLITLVADEVFLETGLRTRAFASIGKLPDADIADYGAAFVRVSPDGARIAVGNNGGAAFDNFEVGVFDFPALTGPWFPVDGFDAEWLDKHLLALAAGDFAAGIVTVLDTNSPDPGNPANYIVIDHIDGASGGVSLDPQGNLYTANGYQPGPPDKTGQVKAFPHSAWSPALSGGDPADFETDGTLIVDLLSGASLGFDHNGNLHVGGGDAFGSGETDFAGLVRGSAVKRALCGCGPADPADPDQVHRLDPDDANDFNFYAIAFNPPTRELYLKDFGPTVYVYRPHDPFAARVIDYAPAPGQFVNNPTFNDPIKALGPPSGGGTVDGNDASVVSLGGFGGSITLAFGHAVEDHRANPHGLDAIVFANAFWVGNHPNRHWAEAGTIEISRDVNENGLADDPWYLIPGSHITDPPNQIETQTWDADYTDPTYPPDNPLWIPAKYVGHSEPWDTTAYRLPADVFDTFVIENPNGLAADTEAIFGYADFSPTLRLGDLDGDNHVDDESVSPETFYTVPDDTLTVGIDARSGGGDAFDVAWAIDPATGEPAELDGFDFIRVTNSVNYVAGIFGEVSAEIDAVADVTPGLLGDADADCDVDRWDFEAFVTCVDAAAPEGLPPDCRVMDFDDDGNVSLRDFGGFQAAFRGDG